MLTVQAIRCTAEPPRKHYKLLYFNVYYAIYELNTRRAAVYAMAIQIATCTATLRCRG